MTDVRKEYQIDKKLSSEICNILDNLLRIEELRNGSSSSLLEDISEDLETLHNTIEAIQSKMVKRYPKKVRERLEIK